METTLLAEHILYSMLNHPEKYFHKYEKICVPITKIDNMECEVNIVYTNDKAFCLKITSQDIWLDTDDDLEQINFYRTEWINLEKIENKVENIQICIDKWFMDLEELKFSKVKGEFIKQKYIDMFAFLKNIKNISCGDDCCVCMEQTVSKTPCNHTICYPCMSQIKHNDEDIRPCPICRKPL